MAFNCNTSLAYFTFSLALLVLCFVNDGNAFSSKFLGKGSGPTSHQMEDVEDGTCPCQIQEFSGYSCGSKSMSQTYLVFLLFLCLSSFILSLCFVLGITTFTFFTQHNNNNKQNT